MKRWQVVCLVCGMICIPHFGAGIALGAYPNRPIELVVPYSPGGNVDVISRIYSEELGRALKGRIIVVNRGGGSGIQGTDYVIRSKKDGLTLLGTAGTPLTIMPAISREVTYDPLKDLIPLGQIASIPSLFVVNNDSRFKTLNELVEYARKNPEKIRNAAAGLGSESQFNLEILCAHNKIKITNIPYNGGAGALVALLGGNGEMASLSLSTLGPQIQAGKIRALAITSARRHPKFPNIPTTAELGYPYANINIWTGILAPAGVPKAILNILISAVEKTFKNPTVIDRATKANFLMEYKGSEEFRKFIQEQLHVAAQIAHDAGMEKQ